jgi:DNA repair protein RecN (Recombination protein N)
MLIRLTVANLAVVADAVLEFGPGLNVVTGETGAGKSLVVGAVGLLVGARASADLVRAGTRSARVEGVFHPADLAGVEALLHELGLGELEDGWLILRREVGADGRSRAFVSDQQVRVSTLRRLGARLVDIHSQGEGHELARSVRQREVLDALAGSGPLLLRLREHLERLRAVEEEIAALRRSREEVARQRDYFEHQLREIEAVDPVPGEDEELRAERRRILGQARVADLVQRALDDLEEADGAALERVSRAEDAVRELAEIDPALGPVAESLSTARVEIEEAARTVSSHLEGQDFSEARRDEVEARLDRLTTLMRRHGGSLAEVVATAARLRDALEEGDGSDRGAALDDERDDVRGEAFAVLTELGERRRRTAVTLARGVESELPSLGMEGASFEVRFRTEADPDGWYEVDGEPVRVGPGGAESVDFLLAANRGQPPGTLRRIASGGELSRVMLALKVRLADADPADVMIFDEADAGIGGRTARAVGERLRRIADARQVIAITHLAPVACAGEHHLRIEKVSGDTSTEVRVRALDGADRIREIARMLSGSEEDRTARKHAKELLAEVGSGGTVS